MIKTRNLTKIYSSDEVETVALKNVNFSAKKGEFVAIMGPSGCGKSTLLTILGLIDLPTSGDYFFCGHDITKSTENERIELRKHTIGFIFQSFNLIDELTVYENVELPLIYHDVPSPERKERVNEKLEQMKIYHKKKHFPQQLSGGQQQRAALARAVVTSPSLIFADEPTGNLDSANGKEVMNYLTKLNESGITLIMATHAPEYADYSRRLLYLHDGRSVSEHMV